MKKCLAIVMALMMLLSAVSVNAFAVANYVGIYGGNLNWVLSDGTLTITKIAGKNGKMADYNSGLSESCWLQYNDLIKKVIMEEGVTSIGRFTFSGCINLETVEIPSTVNEIVSPAFRNSTKITKIVLDKDNKIFTLKDGVLFNAAMTDLILYPSGSSAEVYTVPNGVKTIQSDAFSGCESLSTLNLPAGLTTVDSFAIRCDSLTNIMVPKTVTTIGECALGYLVNGSDIANFKIYGFGSKNEAKAYADANGFRYENYGDCQHSFGAWITTVKPTVAYAGMRVKACTQDGCDFKQEEKLDKIEVTHDGLVDKTSKVTMQYKDDLFLEKLTFSAKSKTKGDVVDMMKNQFSSYSVYEISLQCGDKPAAFHEEDVIIGVPVSDKFSGEAYVGYEKNGVVTAIDSFYTDGFVYFSLDSQYTTYCVADANSELNSSCTCICHKTGFYRVLYFIMLILWRICGIEQNCRCGIKHY